MTDVVDRQTRSRMMSGIKGVNTKPELLVRRFLHKAGFRYKLYDKKLPGKPDLVFPKFRAVIFINGCFWHGHNCHLFKYPDSRESFWRNKIDKTRETDLKNISDLAVKGWRVLQVWECAIKGREKLDFLEVMVKTTDWLKSQVKDLEIIGKHS